jgi:hypothetical protein
VLVAVGVVVAALTLILAWRHDRRLGNDVPTIPRNVVVFSGFVPPKMDGTAGDVAVWTIENQSNETWAGFLTRSWRILDTKPTESDLFPTGDPDSTQILLLPKNPQQHAADVLFLNESGRIDGVKNGIVALYLCIRIYLLKPSDDVAKWQFRACMKYEPITRAWRKVDLESLGIR